MSTRKGPSQYASGVSLGFSIGCLMTNAIWLIIQAAT